MELFDRQISIDELEKLRSEYGSYIKLTADVESGMVVIGPILHADAVPLLKEKGSNEENIWGGWIDMDNKIIEYNAVWNIRPNLNNQAMEILDQKIREKFYNKVKDKFQILWS